MIKKIQTFFNNAIQADNKKPTANLDLATAALLVEMMVTDHEVKPQEREKLLALLQNEFGIATDAVIELIALAEAEVKESTDLYQFTRLVNDNFSYADKCKLIKSLWQMAYADEHLDKYEESSIRKIADLLYIEHSDFIKAKIAVNAQR